jgi:acrylyl-CoA reductase (NADPH)
MEKFRAFRIVNDNGRVQGSVGDATLDQLSAGDVVIRAEFSSVNYKDALAATGSGKILRRFPLIGGIDVAGVVESSSDPSFVPGARVLVTGYDLGVASDGGYAEYVRVPAAWVVPIPDGLTTLEAMTLGTAGFTAALAVVRLERNGLRPDQGPVVVSGATGGVGSVAVACLSRRGYQVTALTGKDDEAAYLRRLGAADVLSRGTLEMGTHPLEKATWAGAVDVVGGEVLAWLTRTTKYWGAVASTGLTGGIELRMTVMPFILRGVSILGIDSVMCPMDVRREVWRRLATDLKPDHLDIIGREIDLEGLPGAFSTLLKGEARGRFVVRLARG